MSYVYELKIGEDEKPIQAAYLRWQAMYDPSDYLPGDMLCQALKENFDVTYSTKATFNNVERHTTYQWFLEFRDEDHALEFVLKA